MYFDTNQRICSKKIRRIRYEHGKEREEREKLWFFSIFASFSFLVIYIGSGIFFTCLGAEAAFKKNSRHVALLAGIVVALLMNRSVKLKRKWIFFWKCRESRSNIDRFNLSFSWRFQGAARAMGGVESVVTGLTFIPSVSFSSGVFFNLVFHIYSYRNINGNSYA